MMDKNPNTQIDDEFNRLLQEFLDSALDDKSDETESGLPADGEGLLPFPKEMDDHVAGAMMNLDRESKRNLADVEGLYIDVMPENPKGRYGRGPVQITLKAAADATLREGRFKCFVYRDGFYPIGNSNSDGVREVCRFRGKRVRFNIPCDCVWLPGRYTLIISDSDDGSVGRYDFTLDDQLEATVEPVRPCWNVGEEDTLVSCLQLLDAEWDGMAGMPGTAQMRHYVIRSRQLMILNEFRESQGAGKVGQCRNLLICTRNDDLTQETVRLFERMVEIEHNFNYIDGTALCDPTRPNAYDYLSERLDEHHQQVICLGHLNAFTTTNGKYFMKRIADKVRANPDDNLLWLLGSRQEIDELLGVCPSLRRFFPDGCTVSQEPYTAYELVQAFFRQMDKESIETSRLLDDRLARAILQGHESGTLSGWSLDDVRRFIAEEIRPRFLSLCLEQMKDGTQPQLTAEDVDLSKLSDTSSAFDDSIAELNGMIGLDGVKQGVMTMANQARLYLERRRRGLKTGKGIVFHSIFTGNPGTGKTTVARKIGKIYRSLGLLSKGEVIAVDRTRLVGQYIGQTEDNMKAVLEEAKGNVLFIDEAYTLHVGSDDKKDFGGRVIDSLLTVLTQPDPDMLIIFAGYPKEMDDMLATNPGLSGRFPYRYHFEDYSADQLMEIAFRLVEREEYILTDEAAAAMRTAITQTLSQKLPNFGNARWIEQFVGNGIIPAMADRVFSTGCDDVQRIEAADVAAAFEKFGPKVIALKSRRHRVTGFSA